MEDSSRHRINPSLVGLFSIYPGDEPAALFQSLWSILEGQTDPLDHAIGVIEGELSNDLESVVSRFQSVEWIRVPLVKSATNFGLPECLNRGLSMVAPGSVVLKIDTDDIYASTRVACTRAAFAGNPKLDLFGGQILEWDDQFSSFVGTRTVPLDHEAIVRYGKFRNPFNGPSVAFRLEPVLNAGGFLDVGANEDYVLWSSLLQGGCLSANSDQILVHMRGGTMLVDRRSTARTRRGELAALKAIYRTGYFSWILFLAHVIFKVWVRRLPRSINRSLYRSVLRRRSAAIETPQEIRAALAAYKSWQFSGQ